MRTIGVTHFTGEYTVRVGASAMDGLLQLPAIHERPVLIVTDKNVAGHWLKDVENLLPHAKSVVLEAGEAHKSLAGVERIWSALAENGTGRDGLVVAFGGGMIGDMAGFAAACWMRGIDFVQVPTTLLAQVDASVGGKTGVDLPQGKNLVGAFHQPVAVLADSQLLQTLPEREYRAGFAEIAKAALLADADFLAWLESNASALVGRDGAALEHAIARSCEIKADIVARDEHERGERAWLNLGHTFGHAIETVTGYERFLHGEAVAIGLVLAARLSEDLCGLDSALRPRIVALLAQLGLPVALPSDLEPDALLAAMRLDKKHVHAHWRLVTLDALAAPRLVELEDRAPVRAVLAGS